MATTINLLTPGRQSRTTISTVYDATLRKEVVNESTTTNTRNKLTGSRTSSTTPGFHKPNRPRLKPLAFNYNEIRYYPATGYTSYRAKNQRNTSSTNTRYSVTIGTWGNDDLEPVLNQDAMDSSLVSKLTDQVNQSVLTKIKNTSANFAVAYAEMHKTASMVGDTATKIAGALVNLKKGNFKKAASSLGIPVPKRASSRFKKGYARDVEKAVASGWLSLSYGWKPLLNDVYGAVDALARNQQRDIVIRSRAFKGRELPIYSSSTSGTAPRLRVVQKGVAYYRVQTSVSYRRPGNSSAVTAKETGLINPLEVAWELVPYSFVVDWFLPIGAYLGTLDATVGLTFLDGYTTVFFRSGYKSDETTSGSDATYTYEGFRTASRSRVYCNRTVLASFPSAGIPRFKNPASLSHMTSALALLSNIFRK